MLITNHVLAGAVIGHVVRRPVVAFVLGLASHAALDVLPHWGDDEKFDTVAPVDGIIGLAALAASVWQAHPRRLPVAAAIFGSCLPDMNKVGERFFGRSPFPVWVDDFHTRIQNETPRRMPVEVLAAAVLRATSTRLAGQ